MIFLMISMSAPSWKAFPLLIIILIDKNCINYPKQIEFFTSTLYIFDHSWVYFVRVYKKATNYEKRKIKYRTIIIFIEYT